VGQVCVGHWGDVGVIVQGHGIGGKRCQSWERDDSVGHDRGGAAPLQAWGSVLGELDERGVGCGRSMGGWAEQRGADDQHHMCVWGVFFQRVSGGHVRSRSQVVKKAPGAGR